MLRFLAIYPLAILLATSIATYVTKHGFTLAQMRPGGAVAQASAATPTQNFGPVALEIPGDWMGQYSTPVQVEGHDLKMMVDTGATFVSLTSEDASELGIKPSPSDFTIRMQTANGISKAARTWLPRVRVGSVEVHDVEAVVMAPGASSVNLLGMSFLSKLSRFGVSNGRMRLEQ
jgi:aspartyl protease family protein